jgi:putative ABC transport system ATP-binding protein/lipoprotein-releasing system ATP-binding protein
MNKSGLHVEHLTHNYRLGPNQVRVLQDVGAEFPAGGICTIQGASGSGKSTLLHILGGLESAEAGEIFWEDQSIYTWSRSALAAWRNQCVGFVFQAYHLLPELSALENVELPAQIQRRPDLAQSKDLLAHVGLKDRWHHRPAELSGGEQQRVAIARALRNRPRLLLADEPTGNLDLQTATEIMELLLSLQQANLFTLILVTHDDTIARKGQHRFRLSAGRLDLVTDAP